MVWGELMNCKDCRFWFPNAEPDSEDDEPRMSSCGPSLPRNGKACTHPAIGGSYNDEAHDAGDAANSYETIIVGPMFGCVHFEGKK